jgi:molybdate transport system ATP-binding protein
MALNFFRGRVITRAPDGLATVACAEGALRIACAEADAEGDELFVAVDPRDVTVHTAAPSGSAQNVFAAAITELVPEPPLGERVRVVLDTTPPLVAEVTAHAVRALALREGTHVWASFKAVAARGYR